ncbi:hypothetical protein BSF40_04750 [Pseudomonas sp. ACN5]|uniref:Uncharacterized protein n=1 Tax=Pseudomonas viciae TaxID=2505979 RepID=A0A4P7PKC7_9PSED|nr:hypothetical protein PU99_05440 [Pseudomonas putida]PBJ10805.1 hypothetical protein BSF40_04750 [Pseudomonas sp. ACN5]PHN28404.1 hypothetical protein AO259_24135 [Pseudomonas sp. ICMP 564]QBZ91261.1 hypothetical protein EPZ47_22025 [Pseudomonas viciae]
MLNYSHLIVQPLELSEPPPSDEYCTVVVRLRGGRSAMGWFLAELSQHFEGSGTAEVVEFEIGDHLRGRR